LDHFYCSRWYTATHCILAPFLNTSLLTKEIMPFFRQTLQFAKFSNVVVTDRMINF
jgi:hypothetical protein